MDLASELENFICILQQKYGLGNDELWLVKILKCKLEMLQRDLKEFKNSGDEKDTEIRTLKTKLEIERMESEERKIAILQLKGTVEDLSITMKDICSKFQQLSERISAKSEVNRESLNNSKEEICSELDTRSYQLLP